MPDGPDEPGEAPAVDGPAWPAEQATRRRLQDIDEAPLEEHVEVYEDVHRGLQEGLADLDEG